MSNVEWVNIISNVPGKYKHYRGTINVLAAGRDNRFPKLVFNESLEAAVESLSRFVADTSKQ